MEHPWPLCHYDLQFVLETVVGDVLQGPVPVVVVELKGDGGNYLIIHHQSYCPDVNRFTSSSYISWLQIGHES